MVMKNDAPRLASPHGPEPFADEIEDGALGDAGDPPAISA